MKDNAQLRKTSRAMNFIAILSKALITTPL